MTPHKGQKALHPLLVGMCVGTFPPMAGNQQAAGPGHEEVKCQEQNVNSCWQAVQKTCSLRLREPWYFTKSNEHVSQHSRATIGLFKEEAQKAGRCYVTCSRDCFHVAQQAKLSSDCGCYPPSTVSLRLWAITESHSEIQWWWDTRGHTVFHVGLSLQNCCALTRQVRCWTQILRVICPKTPSSPEHHVAHSLSYD